MALEKAAGGGPLLVSERLMAQKGLALSSLLKAVSATKSVPAALQEMVEIIRGSVGAVSIRISLDHDGKKHLADSVPVVDEKVRPDALSKTPVKGFLMATGGFGSTPAEGYAIGDFSPTADGFHIPPPAASGQMDIPLSEPVRGFIGWMLDEQAPASLVYAFMTMLVEDLAVLLTDLMERQEQRDEIARLQHIGKVAGHFAHDVRSPLTVMAMTSSEAPPDVEMLRSILDRVYGTARVYGDLLLSRGPTFSRRDVLEVVRNVMSEIQSFPEVREKELVWRLASEGTDFPALMNEPLFRNAVLNLLQNSAYFAPKGGAISVAVRRGFPPRVDATSGSSQPVILIEVEDDGPGISSEQQSKLFHESFTTRPGGHGVGLQSVYETITQLHLGKVHVQSRTGEGSYTRFTIALPAPLPLESPLVVNPGPMEKPGSLEVLQGMTILMNEDDGHLAKLLKTVFTHVGLLPRSAERLDEFVACLADLPQGAIALLDQQTNMGIDAVTLAALVKRRRPDMLTILCSGSYSVHDKPPYPFDGAVAKPFHQDVLLQLLADLAREKKSP